MSSRKIIVYLAAAVSLISIVQAYGSFTLTRACVGIDDAEEKLACMSEGYKQAQMYTEYAIVAVVIITAIILIAGILRKD